jgi:signal transduction histidine kinase
MMLPKIKSSFSAANYLLTNLLDWATTQFRQNTVTPKVLDIRAAVEEVIQANSASIQAKENVANNLVEHGTFALADSNMFKTVIRNLLTNANKFTQGGAIAVSAYHIGDFLEVCIADTGVGMEQVQVERLFSWNKRSSTNGTQGERGSGFGLLVCKDFVEKNGGAMRVLSKRNEGTSFYFTLPKSIVAP